MYGIRFLAALALLISAYLAWTALRSGHLPGCGPESDCDEVLSSRWGYWLGVPVSLGACLIYGLVLGTTFALSPAKATAVRRNAWRILIFAAVVILGAALWFVGVQWGILHKFCPYCMTAHACGSLLACLILFRLSQMIRSARATRAGSPKAVMTSGEAGKVFVGGLAAVMALVAGQVLHQPRTFEVSPPAPPEPAAIVGAEVTRRNNEVNRPARLLTSAPTGFEGAVSASPQTPGSAVGSARELVLHGGVFRLDLQTVPLFGRPDAPYVIVSLFDYTCSYCRVVHQHLMEVHRSLSNQLAIVSLPVPLEKSCNPLVKRVFPEHTNACVYARLGLGVWRADRTRLEAFDDWMFSSARPPSPDQARDYAAKLVGTNKLSAALEDPWGERLLQESIRLYHTNYLVYRQGRMPQLIIGTNLASGQLRNAQELYRLLSNHLGLALPGSPPPSR